MIRNIFIVCCNYMERIYSPTEGHVKQDIIKTRIQLQNSRPIERELVVSDTGCAGLMRKDFRTQTSICRTLFVDRWPGPTDCKIF